MLELDTFEGQLSELEELSEQNHAELRKLKTSLVELRESQNISQEDVAHKLGLTQPAIAAFEKYDSNPTLASVRRYALAIRAKLTISVSKWSEWKLSTTKNIVAVTSADDTGITTVVEPLSGISQKLNFGTEVLDIQFVQVNRDERSYSLSAGMKLNV